ncbi:fimbrillin family protein [uncultured Alistipes sp.]|uniref:fimbrillin family protein n=1 Tax=uncultured Alistipes sp. TaxID=538949 RepID=UPI00262DE7E8|nr:fimbrillin family protein [uncultured Alistipes sp.]
MTTKYLYILLALTLLTACTKNNDSDPNIPSGKDLFVAISCENGDGNPDVSSSSIAPHTSIDNNDWATTHWDDNDRIAIWASADGGSSYTLEAQTFSLAYFRTEFSAGVFSSTISTPMPDGEYTFTGVYPLPQSTNGTQVSYHISAEQSGRYDGTNDIMAADPVTAPALQTFASSDQMLTQLPDHTLHFRHKCHAIRIEIPTDRNIWGVPVAKLQIDFPTEVVGNVSFDATAPSVPMTLSEGGRTITLNLEEPLTEKEENYAWAFINPTSIDGDISFTAFSTEGYRSHTLTVSVNKTMEAGRITPITLTVPEELPVSYLDFSIADYSQLGEEPTQFEIQAPEGMTFRDGSTSKTFTKDSPNKSVAFYADLYGELLKTTPLTIIYESESATGVKGKTTVAYTGEERTAVGLIAPYLLFEDFSEIGEFHTANEDGGVDESSGTILTDWGLENWNAARGGTVANTCIKANCYIATHSALTNSRVHGRIDSRPLPLKPGANVSVSVSFDTGYSKTIWSSDQANSYATLTFGRTDDNSGSPIESGRTLNFVTVQDQRVSELSDAANLPDKMQNLRVDGCSESSRLTWQIYSNRDKIWATTSVSVYCHVDNIRVTIVK